MRIILPLFPDCFKKLKSPLVIKLYNYKRAEFLTNAQSISLAARYIV